MQQAIHAADFLSLFLQREKLRNHSDTAIGKRFKEKGYDSWSSSKEQKVHKVFEKISVDYDKMNSVISFNQHKKWRNDIMCG